MLFSGMYKAVGGSRTIHPPYQRIDRPSQDERRQWRPGVVYEWMT
jgi:hypothetical protein